MKVAPVKPIVSLDVLRKVDIRVGKIELVQNVPTSQRLVRLLVDFGDHKRRILAGVRQGSANLREKEGEKTLFVVNLETKKMMGEVSEGLLLDIGYEDGIKPVLAVPGSPVSNWVNAG